MKNHPAAQDSGEVIFFMILTQKETMLLQDPVSYTHLTLPTIAIV